MLLLFFNSLAFSSALLAFQESDESLLKKKQSRKVEKKPNIHRIVEMLRNGFTRPFLDISLSNFLFSQ